ncbi:MAG: glycoside hydrolase family 2 [Sediminibacterium sp.]
MHKILLTAGLFFATLTIAQTKQIQYLSGTGSNHTVTWNFFCTKGMNSGKWTTIQVPSNWEMQGFGGYNYGHDKVKNDEQGLYRKHFTVARSNANKKVFIVFEGSMTDTEVRINGKLAGPVHQGGFYRFKYDITEMVKFGADNLLEVTVSKMSADTSVNRAERNGDFWVFGGIYRPVYLEIAPSTFIDRVSINAKADGTFSMEVFTVNTNAGYTIEAQVQQLNGENVGNPLKITLSGEDINAVLTGQFKSPVLWNPEFPHLYQVVVSLHKGKNAVYTTTQRFGFRTVELRLQDGIYVNNKKIIFKGIDRHSEWPETGRCLNKEISMLDIGLIKEMNMNAVRMSHYPPDQHFLDLCDSLGLFVLDELTGWHAAYDTAVGRKLVKELVVRDVNHPSVVLWANGNEGGWNRALDNDFKLYDLQQRVVYHPWEKFNGLDTKHYPDYTFIENAPSKIKEVFMPTEFMHGLYDGGHGAALDDCWRLMMQNPRCAGGFLWVFVDGGIVRTDKKDGKLDTDGNHAPDGIVGPHREKEASFYTIKEIWAPVHIEKPVISPAFDGVLTVENRYLFTNLRQCSFKWKLVSFSGPESNTVRGMVNASGDIRSAAIAPGGKGTIRVNLPANWAKSDALYVTAYDPFKREIFTWSWPLKTPLEKTKSFLTAIVSTAIKSAETDSSLTIQQDGLQYFFDKKTGYLSKVITPKATVSLSGGPVLAGMKHTLQECKYYAEKDRYIVEPVYSGEGVFRVKWVFHSGLPVQLQYEYAQKGEADFMGITFDYPEEKITGMKWMGRGPYRVWKNRLKGMQFGVWQKEYNNTITGESWQYPEFKGYHAELYWVEVQNKESNFLVYTAAENMFFQMLKAGKPAGAGNNNTSPAFPEGNIGFLNAISPIGTKFQAAVKMGPQSQKNTLPDGTTVKGSLWFDFK